MTTNLKHPFASEENIVGKKENAGLPAFSSFPALFSKSVFHEDVSETRNCVVRVNPFPNKPWFLPVCTTRKTLWKKEKLLVMSNFSFFHSVFYPFGELLTIFIKFEILVCKLSQFGRV